METAIETSPGLIPLVGQNRAALCVLLRQHTGLDRHAAECATGQCSYGSDLGSSACGALQDLRESREQVDLRGHECDLVRSALRESRQWMDKARGDDLLATIRCGEAVVLLACGEALELGGTIFQEGDVERGAEAPGRYLVNTHGFG